MKPIQILTPTEQVALHLEKEILQGGLTGKIPGVKSLAIELGVNHKTVDGAMKILEFKNLVKSNGVGQHRSTIPQTSISRKSLKINILLYDPDDAKHHYMIDMRDKLTQIGHDAGFATKSLTDLKMDISRIKSLTTKYPADAWIVQSAGREVLQWFAEQPFPAFALFGRFRNISIPGAGTTKEDAIQEAVRKLFQLGHRRIAMLVQEEQRMPHPAPTPKAFLHSLEELGILSGRYNLPYWQQGSESFRGCLDSLFQHTPPTALFIPEPSLFIATQQHLANKGITAPKQVSMICHDPSPVFHYCYPKISHLSYDLRPCVRRMLQWVKNVASGKDDRRQTLSKSHLVEGGTIGSPPKQ